MKTLALILVVASAILAASIDAHAAEAPRIDACAFYPATAKRLGCPADGYLTSFGDRYCRLFVRDADSYSAPGRQFLAKVRSCLVDVLGKKPGLTCENVRAIAIASHIPCYVNSGFCELSFFDRQRILGSVWPEMKRPDFIDAALKIQGHCQKPLDTP